MLNRNNKKERTAIEDLIKAKVFVNPARLEELERLREELWRPDAVLPESPCTLLCLNLSQPVEDALRELSSFVLQVEHVSPDPANKEDRKRFVKLFAAKRLQKGGVSAIVHELSSMDEELTLFDRRVIALSVLNKLPVICVATAAPDALAAASAATGHTWPVFFAPHPEDSRSLCEWLVEQLPRVRALAAAIEADLQARVAPFAKVNAPWHFLSRASVALVPFGVMTVNFLGIVRLMANLLQVVGMRGDTSANKALSMLGAQNAALVIAVDSLVSGDSKPAAAAGAKARWWHRKASAPAGALGGTCAAAEAEASAVGGDDGGEGSISSSSGGSGDEEEDGQAALVAAVARDERMGLDEATRMALMDFLSLPDAEVYGGGSEEPVTVAATPAMVGPAAPVSAEP
ncbi:hypothetical protein TSOC_003013 [Tetrabaena socialis]|uniref:Uncharacterized protein n=1 Tax=Tetrabaena socialis TaxID=47790 RepID=A0A2J8ACM4_9CHLO|nr:hypothetical protein TSOC_003013 [Tetrabaena socialis]|eukprot:PNH10274.1 hypothetical protein TSOC_003013 [Tetrabaena socialis]